MCAPGTCLVPFAFSKVLSWRRLIIDEQGKQDTAAAKDRGWA